MKTLTKKFISSRRRTEMENKDIIKARASGHQAKLITQELLKEHTEDIVNSSDFGTLGAYFEADTAQKKIKEPEQQLIEKDKEIEELKEQAEIWHKLLFEKMETQIVGVTNEKLKEIRHQVCEELREKIKSEVWSINQGGYHIGEYVIPEICQTSIFKILDQIEKGENDGTRNSKNV